ncbi:MAG TPA: hypothetical protein VEB43_05010 [Anaeromyxobacter sp.]|nr:hypothetical protein [Anaeromyxobacter sp.]
MPDSARRAEASHVPSPGGIGADGWHPAPSAGAPPVRGTEVLTATLPSGRIAWLQLDPPLAPVPELNHLAHAVERMEHRRAAEAHAATEALRRLSRTVAADAARLSTGAARRRRRLWRRLAREGAALERRTAARSRALAAELAALRRRERALARRLDRRDLWDQLVVASAFPLFAAYGQRADPLAERNLVLSLSVAIWLVGDEISDFLSGARDARDVVRKADLWSYVAPAANLLSGWLLLQESHHRRFATGVSDVGPPRAIGPGQYLFASIVELPPLGDGDPERGTPAVASALAIETRNPPPGVTAKLQSVAPLVQRAAQTLAVVAEVTVDPPATPADVVAAAFPAVRVAWMVDTQGA